jgi:hypothetical protein
LKTFHMNSRALYFCAALLMATFMGGTAIRAANAGGSAQLTKNEALKLTNDFQKATVAGDAATLDKLMANDCIFIHGNGMVQSKAVFTSMLTSGRMKVTSWDMKSPDVMLFNGGAIVTGESEWVMAPPPGSASTNPMSLHLRVSQIWVHTAKGWQLILDQDTSIAQPQGMRPVGSHSAPGGASHP